MEQSMSIGLLMRSNVGSLSNRQDAQRWFYSVYMTGIASRVERDFWDIGQNELDAKCFAEVVK